MGGHLWQSTHHLSVHGGLGCVCLYVPQSGTMAGTALGLQAYLVADRFVLKSWLVHDHLQLPAVEIGYSNRLCQACIFTCLQSLQRKQRQEESHVLA